MTDLDRVATGLAEVSERATASLHSAQRLQFLAQLVAELTVGARTFYPEPGTGAYRTVAGFVCYNELLHVVSNQLVASVTEAGGGYTSQALIDALAWKARTWGCVAGLGHALARALRTAEEAPQAEDSSWPDLAARALGCLGTDRHRSLLVGLVYEATLEARALYPPRGTEAARWVAGFVCHNELLHVAAARLRADLGVGGPERRDAAVIEELIAAATTGGCVSILRYALERTLARVPARP